MNDPVAAIFANERELADAWDRDAESRRALWADDPVAKVLAYCAGELRRRVSAQELRASLLTVAEFAALRGTTPQTVWRWIRSGQLHATKTTEGYVIERDAVREKPKPAVKAKAA